MLRQAMTAHQAGKLAEAEALYKQVLVRDSAQFAALQMLGLLNAQRGNFEEAERLLRNALTVNANDAGAQFNHGNTLIALQRLDEALQAFGKALALKPDFAEAALNRGSILLQRRQFEDAILAYDKVISVNASFADAYCNRGIALEELKRFDAALANYDKALALNPGKPEFHASRGNVLHKLRRYQDALDSIGKAIALSPGNPEFFYNRGNILFELNRYDAAYADYDQAFRRNPDLEYLEGDRLFAKMLICNWSELEAERARLMAGVTAGKAAIRPFAFLAFESSPSAQTKCASTFMGKDFPLIEPLWKGERRRHDRIRLAYVSGDFREHPVSHLLAGVFERNDRARFETIALSFGPAEPTPMRRRLEKAFDRFIDVRDKSDADVARMLNAAEVDIAVDLMGPTQHARPGIFSHRPAPIQALYLGYTGSSGADYFDYLIADRFVIPEAEQTDYREKIVYLPETYMGTDAARPIAKDTPSRAQEGLPPTGFVFGSFNNSYKITPPIFGIWMRLLRAVDGSVLWLANANEPAMRNLRREAQARQVDADRLVFARRVERNDEHLARCRLADLFLDTVPFGAHSTACDALWAGVPLLTCRGATFSGRVAGSLLNAVGLPELVTDTREDYEASALALARDPSLLASLKEKLARHRKNFPLFNTERFTRHLEAGYLAMWERYQRGDAPATIRVAPIDT